MVEKTYASAFLEKWEEDKEGDASNHFVAKKDVMTFENVNVEGEDGQKWDRQTEG